MDSPTNGSRNRPADAIDREMRAHLPQHRFAGSRRHQAVPRSISPWIPRRPVGSAWNPDRPAPPAEGSYFFGACHASVTALSMMCRSTLEHRGQPNVRKSWPKELGSIAVNFIGEPQVVHCGPWFCTSSMGFPSRSAGALPSSRSPITAVAVR